MDSAPDSQEAAAERLQQQTFSLAQLRAVDGSALEIGDAVRQRSIEAMLDVQVASHSRGRSGRALASHE
jgi:hypothetical protein